MLNWYVMQFNKREEVITQCCDLMLNWYVMQSKQNERTKTMVVI